MPTVRTVSSAQLPFVDELSTIVAAPAGDVWSALLDTLYRSMSRPRAARYARLVGCDPATESGPQPLAEGATIPGFRVAAAVAPSQLGLEGRHRFADYALTFHIDELGPTSSALRAVTRARFPGVFGRVYRLAVIRSGGHVVLARRLLDAARRRAEAAVTSRVAQR